MPEKKLNCCISHVVLNVQCQAFVPNTGRGVQAATSHCLGQNFAKMFEINFENEKGEKAMVWQNSWAYTTRSVNFTVNFFNDLHFFGFFGKF